MRTSGLGQAVLLCAAFVGAQILFAIPLAIAGLALDAPLAQHPLCLAVVNVLAFCATIGLVWILARPSFGRLWRLRRLSLKGGAAVLFATLGAVVVYSEIDNLFRMVLPVPAWMEPFFEGFEQAGERPWAGAVLLVIVAPITEELLFRGVILNGLLTRYRPWPAILLSTILFMLVHLNPWQFAAAAGLGVMAGWVYHRTRSLTPCLLVHVVQNGMVCLVPWLPVEIEGFTNADFFGEPTHQPLGFTAVGVSLLVGGILSIRRFCPAIPPEYPVPESDDKAPEQLSDTASKPPPLPGGAR